MRVYILRARVMLLGLILAGALFGCGHDPNHDIDMEKARAAANRVHPAPKLTPSERAKAMEDHGG
jgi:hypothetical protein